MKLKRVCLIILAVILIVLSGCANDPLHITGINNTIITGNISAWGNISGNLSNQTDLQNQLIAINATVAGKGTSNVTLPINMGNVTGLTQNLTDTFGNVSLKAPIASPNFTGTVNIPTLNISGNVTVNGTLNATTISPRTCQIKLTSDDVAITVGNGTFYWFVPDNINGYNLTSAIADVSTNSTSGNVTMNIYHSRYNAYIFSTALSIDVNESSSRTAAVPVVINTAYDDVAIGDMLRFDIINAGTSATGLQITMTWTNP